LVAADPLDRVDADLPAVDAHLRLGPDLVRDVGRRHRAEERARWACLHLEAQLRLRERARERLRLVGRLRLVPGDLRLTLAQLGDARRRRLLGEPAREEVVARVPARDRDDVAPQADLLDVGEQDHLHQRSRSSRRPRPPPRSPLSVRSATYDRSAISRARLTAWATCTWWRRHAPVMRRLRILPFSEM